MAVRRIVALTCLGMLLLAAPARAQSGAEGGATQACTLDVVADLALTEDLHCSLRLVASGVTIDLGGFTLHGWIQHLQVGGPPVRDVLIRDGAVTGTINLAHTSGVELRGLTMREGTTAFFAVDTGYGTVVADSHFEGHYIGVRALDDWSTSVVVENSTFVGNTIGVYSDAVRSRFVGNRFVGNGTGLFVSEYIVGIGGGTVSGNHFDGNGIGLRVDLRTVQPWSDALEISGNRIFGSTGVGMSVRLPPPSFESPVEIAHNHLAHNAGDGARIEAHPGWDGDPFSLESIVVSGNRAFHNGAFGIHAVGVTDGGGNHARHNGEDAQCVGVDCRPPGRQR